MNPENEVTEYHDITGVIKVLKPEGFGFIIPDVKIKSRKNDVFFHATALADADVDWHDVQIGQKVHMGKISINGKGMQALHVTIVRTNSRARSARE